jgi:Flp pilus assembly protein TadD
MGWIAMRRRQLDLAGQHLDRAVGLNPNDVSLAVDRANWLMYVNRFLRS